MIEGNEGPVEAPPSEKVSAWLHELERSHRADDADKYDRRCRTIRRRYRYERSVIGGARKYQLLWSTVETLKGVVYSKPPQPVVSRRYRDADPVGRTACEVLERSIGYVFDSSDFDNVFKQVRDDFLLYGRGVARIYYEQGPDEGKEKVNIRFIQRADFRHQACRTWDECGWVAFRSFMTRREVTERFGEKIGKEIGLDSGDMDSDKREDGGWSKDVLKAAIWEIWDKANNKVLWVAKSHPDILDEGLPHLVLDGFYPCPCPAYGTRTTDSLIPVPDYVFYQDQCEEIDQLTARIASISDSLKLVGFYPAGPQGEGSPEIEKAFSADVENAMIAVQSWDAFRQGGGGGAPVVFLPIEHLSEILQSCIELRKQLVEDVYQIIGISDIMRGATDPHETEGAQHLKAQFGGNRVRDKQQEIARFCRDVGRICGQVIATYCSPETIGKMTNINLPTEQDLMISMMSQADPGQPPAPTEEAVFGLLRDSMLRRFKVEIENESTIAGDEHQEKQDRTYFIQSMTQYMEAWGPMVMHKPELAPLAGKMLLFGIRAFRVGRELEETVESLSEWLQSSAQAPQQPQPDPRVEAEKVKLIGTQAKVQAEILKSTMAGETAKLTAQAKLQEARLDGQAKIAELRLRLAQAEQEHHHKTVEAGLEHAATLDKMAFDDQKQRAAAAKLPDWPKGQKGF